MKFRAKAFAAIVCALWSATASASLVLDKVIIDLEADGPARGDIELLNDGEERMYVAVEPFEVLNPDTDFEKRVELTLEKSAPIFVSPRRLILEPGERRLLRIALLGERPEVERIFRVRVRPVSGDVVSETDGLKVLVGYDTLVLLRPALEAGSVVSDRESGSISVENRSNSSVEFFDGKACIIVTQECRTLAPNRLYPGEKWVFEAKADEQVEFLQARGRRVVSVKY
ncbi:molecular chaperone [Qipengyuania gaetbuli]|uniref:fimbrial biogenesis chaperone n=1 Tax=Qipengyuania gaetbuli TaxID=266952 RepID=UPI001CD1F535|nr:hypothetical protein [Qipengyuania gaetbuli]MCA0911047.1 hypothetical protein [Qipengyuania gaetbuli]